jgi:hypothetical protein
MTSAPRAAPRWPGQIGRVPRRRAASGVRRHRCRAERALASQRREARADATKSAAFTAYFLGGGRYL